MLLLDNVDWEPVVGREPGFVPGVESIDNSDTNHQNHDYYPQKFATSSDAQWKVFPPQLDLGKIFYSILFTGPWGIEDREYFNFPH